MEGGQSGAVGKGVVTDGGKTWGKSDGCELWTGVESPVCNGGDVVGGAIVGKGGGNADVACVGFIAVGDSKGLLAFVEDVVVDAVGDEVVALGVGTECTEKAEAESEKCREFHAIMWVYGYAVIRLCGYAV